MSKSDKVKIEVTKDGPYIAKNIKKFKNSKSEDIESKDTMALCRCGASSNKPFCDGTHVSQGFSDEKKTDREEDRKEDCKGKELTIHDNRGVCAHLGYCTDNSPKVFRSGKEPWIDPDGEGADKAARTIRMCPSGALHYTKEGEKWSGENHAPEVKIYKDGPLCVRGAVELVDSDGNKPELKEHYTLCRCGHSKNKPFCDGQHWYKKFKDEIN